MNKTPLKFQLASFFVIGFNNFHLNYVPTFIRLKFFAEDLNLTLERFWFHTYHYVFGENSSFSYALWSKPKHCMRSVVSEWFCLIYCQLYTYVHYLKIMSEFIIPYHENSTYSNFRIHFDGISFTNIACLSVLSLLCHQ